MTAEAFDIHARLTILLSSIDHERILLHQYVGNKCGDCLLRICSKEVAGDTLLIMVLKEVEHVGSNVVVHLPCPRKGIGAAAMTDNVTHHIVHADLVIKIIKAGSQIVTILTRVIDLTDKQNLRISLFDFRCCPCPESGRHHLGHVATETINALGSPEQQDVEHFLPSRRDDFRRKMERGGRLSGIVVDTVVQLHRLVPVVLPRSIAETIITCGLGWCLAIGFLLVMIQIETRSKRLTWTIIEVVLKAETH